MSQEYLTEDDRKTARFIHIPFTPYFLVKATTYPLWRIYEKELNPSPMPIYRFRKL
jgi:hypothetical protein